MVMFSVASFSCALFIPDTSQTLPDHFLHLGSIFGVHLAGPSPTDIYIRIAAFTIKFTNKSTSKHVTQK